MNQIQQSISQNTTHLGWVSDPEHLPGLSKLRPECDAEFAIVGKYRRIPQGGRKQNPDGPWIWCSHCQKESHWEGFVVQTELGTLHLIGKDCGQLHYGADRFKSAHNVFASIEKRENLTRDIGRLQAAAKEIIAEIDQITESERYKDILGVRSLLQQASPEALSRLRSAAITGSLLTYEETVTPKGTTEVVRVDLGKVEGDIVVWERELSAIQEAKSCMMGIVNINVAELDNKTLLDIKKKSGYALREIVNIKISIEDAQLFFSNRNIGRLARWSHQLRRFFTISAHEDGLLIWDTKKGNRVIRPINTQNRRIQIQQISEFSA